jgi:hypothetical protein
MQTALSVPPHHWVMRVMSSFVSWCLLEQRQTQKSTDNVPVSPSRKTGKVAISFEDTLFMIVLELLLGG